MKRVVVVAGLILPVLFFMTTLPAYGQRKKITPPATTSVPGHYFNKLDYRLIGPFRGGRSAAVTGIEGNRQLFYMGSTGGGVWKSEDAGTTWKNCSDGFFGGTIGAVAVAPSDINVVYAAGGEKTVRGNVSHGYGIWKSVDGGETWIYKGLKEGQYIPRLRVHPTNPDLVYAAVLGHIFGPNSERGVYRSSDGGTTWEKVLYVDENCGAVDLVLDPVNPRIIYASTWRVRRSPYSLESGGEGSALWRSNDSGSTWKKISDNKGFAKGTLGIIGVSLSADNPRRLYALAEAEKGGLFVSDDRGESWRIVNDDRNLRQRAWYYTRLYADPADSETLYVLNVGFHKSTDGGKTFERISTPHGDHHDLWIDPADSRVMIIGDDGGAQVTHDGGKSWSSLMNQPTGQFYRVVTDNHFPYRIYGGQQDNSTVRISSMSLSSGAITESDWESTAGGESGWLAPDPLDSDIVYGGSYGGYIARVNHRTGEYRRVDVWPDNPMGWGADSLKERFQWNFPILFSRHDPHLLYAASNRLWATSSEGEDWKALSPDLTRNDLSRMGPSGGPITKDNTSVEYYGTIFAVAESVSEKGVIWCGSDDGLIHITSDGGKSWKDVTPDTKLMPEWTMINSIEADPFNPGGLFVAATSYKMDDFRPLLFHTTDYGMSWRKITNGIENDHFTRVIRCDSEAEGLLYCGTESGIYISFNNGVLWQTFQNNLPVVPVTDLAVKGNDLIVATQGRSFWIFDYLHIIRQLKSGAATGKTTLFTPAPAVRSGARRSERENYFAGENPLPGAVISFWLPDEAKGKDIALDIIDFNGELACSFRSNTANIETGSHTPARKFTPEGGLNTLAWELSYPGAYRIEDMILWSGSLQGPVAVPGEYRVVLAVGTDTLTTGFEVVMNPLSSSDREQMAEQFLFVSTVRDKLSETHRAIEEIRKLTGELDAAIDRVPEGNEELGWVITETRGKLKAIEERLYQTKNRSPQDPLNYPIRLGNKLAALNGVAGTGDFRPTRQSYQVRDMLIAEIDGCLDQLKRTREVEISKLNKMMLEAKLPYIGRGDND